MGSSPFKVCSMLSIEQFQKRRSLWAPWKDAFASRHESLFSNMTSRLIDSGNKKNT